MIKYVVFIWDCIILADRRVNMVTSLNHQPTHFHSSMMRALPRLLSLNRRVHIKESSNANTIGEHRDAKVDRITRTLLQEEYIVKDGNTNRLRCGLSAFEHFIEVTLRIVSCFAYIANSFIELRAQILATSKISISYM